MKRLDLIAILCAWAAAIALIHPTGNFPLDDDWDFAIATWRFARTGHFHFTAFTAASVRAQVLWGALWTRLFGESFEVLRASTLTLAAGTIVIVHRSIARAGAGRFACAAGALALAFHPVFFWASCTYMTEVPFVFASAVALYFFVRGIGEGRQLFFVCGYFAVIASWFVRQTGVTHAMAVLALLLLFRERLSPRWRTAALGAAAVLAFFVVLLIFRRDWLAGAPVEFTAHFRMWRESSFRLPQQLEVAYHYGDFNIRNAALFLLPLVAPIALVFPRRSRVALAVVAGAFLLFSARALSLIGRGLPMPYFVNPYCCDIFAGNILMDIGLGPLTLKGSEFAYPFRLAYGGRLLLTYLSVLAGALLLGFLIISAARAAHEPRRNAGFLVALAFTLFASLGLLGNSLYVDRYALDSAWPMAIALALVLPWDRVSLRWTFVAALLLIVFFDVAAMHDYFAWNQARWTAINGLRSRGVPVQSIDGGAEAFAFYEMAYMDRKTQRHFMFGVPPRPYVIAFGPLPGYVVESEMPFDGWLTGGRGRIVVLRAPH